MLTRSGDENLVTVAVMLRAVLVIAGGIMAVLGGVIGSSSAASVPIWSLAGAIALAAAAAVRAPTERLLPLRTLEAVVFGGMATILGLAGATAIADAPADLVPRLWSDTTLRFAVLVGAYGVLVPNTIRRAAVAVVVLSGAPFAMLAVLDSRAPAAARAIIDGGLAGSITSFALAAVLALLATAIIGLFRSLAVKTRVLDMYELVERIGEGGMGEVWRAEHHRLARPAAIKIIRPEMLGGSSDKTERLLQRFELEARSTASLRSPNTVEVYDFGTTRNGTFFYVMEFLDGMDLQTLVSEYGPMPAERVVYLMLQACESLGDAHANRLIHRDIKPANIHIDRMGLSFDYVKILDFGLAKPLDGNELDNTIKTLDGELTGTPAYMSPEMVTGDKTPDARSDLYALACVGYFALTGELVFPIKEPLKMAVAHALDEPEPPSARTSNPIPKELDDIIMRCLQKTPTDRFESVADLARALAAVPLQAQWTNERAREWWSGRPRLAPIETAPTITSDPSQGRALAESLAAERPPS